MNLELLWVVGLLATTVALFIHNRLRLDVIALLVIMAFSVSGTLTLNEALAGFSDPSVILIAALFVIGEGLVRTGVAYQVGDWLIARAGSSEARLLVLLMLAVAGLGSVMSSTGVVAIFIPVVLSIAAKLKIPPGRLMMPLAFAGLISGMMTLVATPPNMVVNSELAREGHAGFGFFAFTPIGLMVLAIGVAYMLLTRNWLNAASPAEVGAPKARRTLRDLIRDYRLAGRERRLQVQLGSPLIGSTLEELQLRTRLGANVVGLERVRKFHSEVVKVGGSTELKAGDVLLLDVFAPPEDMDRRCAELNLVRLPFRASYFIDQSREVGMAEVTLPPDSTLLGKSVLELGFRSQYGLNVVGLRRDHEALTDGMLEEKLRLGDTLLVIGAWAAAGLAQWRYPLRAWAAPLLASWVLIALLPAAMPNHVVQNKTPDLFVAEHLDELTGAHHLLSNDLGAASALAWRLRRSDVTLYDTRGELKYGLSYPEHSQRSVPLADIRQWLWRARQDGSVAVLLRINSASDRYQLALLPGDGERYRNGNLVLAILPQVRP